MFKKIYLFIFIFILIMVLQASFAAGLLPAEPSQSELEDIKKEQEETEKKIEQAQLEQDAYSMLIQQVEDKLLAALTSLEIVNKQLHDAKTEMDRISLQLASNEVDIARVERELREKSDLLDNRVMELYKQGDKEVLNLLMKTDDIEELFTRLQLMNLTAKNELTILEEVREKRIYLLLVKKNITDLKDRQKIKKEEIEELIILSEEKKYEIESIYNEKQQLFSVAAENKDVIISMENLAESKAAEISLLLMTYDYGEAPKTKLQKPVNGIMRSGFGYRIHPIINTERMHSGIDIDARPGTPVVSAENGQVVRAEYNGSYGYLLVIYHGGGFATCYAHLSGFAVSIGQRVEKGQLIGYVGNTGWSTGPHLHFEVRLNGVPQNPSNYL